MFCTKCGKQLDDGAEVCPECGAPTKLKAVKQVEVKQKPADKVNVWLCILSALIPVAGLIFFIVWQKEKPRQAKICGICALVVFIVEFIAGMIAGLCIGLEAAKGNGIGRPNMPNNSQQQEKPDYTPEKPTYESTADGVLVYAYFGEGNKICYDNLTDAVIVWNSRSVRVYGRTDNVLRYSADYTLDVSSVYAYDGMLCVGFGGQARRIDTVNLQTGEERSVSTEISVEQLVVTNARVYFCDGDQWCNLHFITFIDYSYGTFYGDFYQPRLAVNHDKGILYLVETGSSSCKLVYIGAGLEKLDEIPLSGEDSYNRDGVYYDGEYVHAFGCTYNAITGVRMSNLGYVEKVNSSDVYLLSTLRRNGNCSLISEYNNSTVVFNNKSKKIITTLKLLATQIYYIGGSIYMAVCGESGYVGHIDLSKYKINGNDAGTATPGKGGEVEVARPAQPAKPDRAPQAATYKDTEDGLLTFTSYGSGKKICYDQATDSVIAWSTRKVTVYDRATGQLNYSFDYSQNVSAVSAYGGTLCVGMGGQTKRIAVIDLRTGASRTVNTQIEVAEIAVTKNVAAYCDDDQWCNVVVLDLNTLNNRSVPDTFYEPSLAINHEDATLYLVERHLSNCDFVFINLNTLQITECSNFGDYVYNGDGVYYDGRYVHAFGNTYDGETGAMVARRGYAENVKTSDLYLMQTVCVNGKYSFISEYDNKTVLYDGEQGSIICTMKLAATEIYHVSGELYIAVCGTSGYTCLIDLSKT